MDAPDGQVPAPRRAGLPRQARPSAPTDLTGLLPGEDAPRVPQLSALLAEIDALRLTLQTDLSLAAAALEAGADELAGELVDSDLSEVRAFAGRAARHLEDLDAGQVADEVEVGVPVRRRRILSAAPLMAAAAALVGFVTLMPTRGAATPEPSMSSAALASELSRLASEGAPDEQLRRAAEELNDELAALISRAADDPAAAQQAMMLLEQTTEVLSGEGDSGVLRSVMAETRALQARLREALPAVAQRPRPVRPAVRTVVPLLPRVQEQPEKERASAEASAEPKKTSKPSPSASPTPAPAAPTPAPTPAEQQPSPSSSGSPAPEGPLPQPGDAPGGGLPGV